MGYFTKRKKYIYLILILKTSFGSFDPKEVQQGKLILSFNALGLEIAFSLENEKTVFGNQNTLYAFIIYFSSIFRF